MATYSAVIAGLSCATALLLTACGGDDDTVPYAELESQAAITVATVPQADVTLLTHTMPASAGGSTRATALLWERAHERHLL